MPVTFNWLHITDLHFGLDQEGWLWPGFRNDFMRDLEKQAGQVEGWDVVFFTGDLVQSGTQREYENLSRELEKLWELLSRSGKVPLLCVVPGNHDLERPDPLSPPIKALTRLWQTDPDVSNQFWREANCEYRESIKLCFENFSSWHQKLSIPKTEISNGVLPGDFSTTISKQGIDLGIIGLNSTFLQLEKGNFEGRLELHVSQINKVCDGDPDDWLSKRSASVLLTHQPPSWLSPSSLAHFKQQIYTPGRFIAQLCGHQHEPEASEISEAGADPRRLRQGPSLFGLEKWEGVEAQKRIHGYNSGQFIFDNGEGLEKYWPRTAIMGRHGALHLSPDHSYKLQAGDCVVTPFLLSNQRKIDTPEVVEIQQNLEGLSSESGEIEDLSRQIFEKPMTEDEARDRLSSCGVLPLAVGSHHTLVRQDEQSAFEHELRKSRVVWVKADWGSAKEEFLASCIARFRKQNEKADAFVLRCDECINIDDIEAQFPIQFGLSLQLFCSLVISIPNAFLIIDDLHNDFASGDQLKGLKRLSSAILDYCQNIRIIFSSRLVPDDSWASVVVLDPLEVPDVRTYVTHHPDFQEFLKEPEVIEKLHEKSDGLPMHIDRMLRALQVSSLSTVLGSSVEAERFMVSHEDTPKAIQMAVDSIAKSTDKRAQRSFKLLKVLSLLTYGETIETLGHYFATEPFFPDNAIQLSELALLDIIILHRKIPHVKDGFQLPRYNSPRLLKVSRSVRGYVTSLISDSERKEIVDSGIERYFGRFWRSGDFKLRKIPHEFKDYLNSGVGNEFALIQELIVHSKEVGDEQTFTKASSLAVYYTNHLKNLMRYKDQWEVAESLLQLIDSEREPKDWSIVAFNAGHGYRMFGRHGESLDFLNRALEVGGDLISDTMKAQIHLNIALAEDSLGRGEAALMAAEKVLELVDQDSGYGMHAQSIVIGQKIKGASKIAALKELESKARSSKKIVLADNLALELSRSEKNAENEVKQLEKVLSRREFSYNQARAIISKAEAVGRLKVKRELSKQEVQLLAGMYSYLYTQRLTVLFNRCHDALWNIFEARGDTDQLIRLFRYASFLWRIRGEDEREMKYLKRLSGEGDVDTKVTKSKLLEEVGYFMRRFKILVNG